MCTNGVQWCRVAARIYTAGSISVGPPSVTSQRSLLGNVYLFLFVYVAQEIYQTTNKRDCCQPKRDPSRCVTAGRVRVGHKFIEVVDRSDGRRYAYQYRENIFQAFHFEPPAKVIDYEGKGKSRLFTRIMAAC